MKDFDIVLSETPKLKQPFFLEGLPGMGNIGRICTNHLINVFHAKKFGDMYSTAFPHQVKGLPDGTVRRMRNELYYSTSPRDIIYLSGDMQPLPTDFKSHYLMAMIILDICKQLGVKLIITLGGYCSERNNSLKPKVFGAASSPGLTVRLKEFGLELFDDEPNIPIVGVSGLIPALAATRGIEAVCLLGETVASVKPDAKAAAEVINKIGSILDIDIDPTDLHKSADSIEKEMDDIIKRIGRIERMRTDPDDIREHYIH